MSSNSYIKSGDLINDKVNVIVDTTNFTHGESISKLSDYDSGGFEYLLTRSVERVSQINIKTTVIPKTFYNINRDQTRLDFIVLEGSSLISPTKLLGKTIFSDAGSYTTASIIAEINAQYANNPMFGYVLTVEWNTFKPNTIAFILTEPDISITRLRIKMLFYTLLKKLGFNSIGLGYQTIIGNTGLDLGNILLDITNENNIIILNNMTTLVKTSIVFVVGVYNIYNIVFAIQKGLEDTGLVLGPFIGCEYLSKGKNLMIRFNELTNTRYEVMSTSLSITLGIDTIKSNSYAIADNEINFTFDTNNLLFIEDLTSFSIRGNSNTMDIKIPEGIYENITDIITEVKTALDETGPLFPYDITYNSVRKKVTVDFLNSTEPVMVNSGLATLLGHFLTGVPLSINTITAIEFANSPKLFTKFIYINSRKITSLKKNNTIGDTTRFENNITSVPFDNSNIQTIITNSTIDIPLSRKETIKSFDIYITDDDGYIINFNGGEILIHMEFLIS
jgi:hypothetical protein